MRKEHSVWWIGFRSIVKDGPRCFGLKRSTDSKDETRINNVGATCMVKTLKWLCINVKHSSYEMSDSGLSTFSVRLRLKQLVMMLLMMTPRALRVKGFKIVRADDKVAGYCKRTFILPLTTGRKTDKLQWINETSHQLRKKIEIGYEPISEMVHLPHTKPTVNRTTNDVVALDRYSIVSSVDWHNTDKNARQHQ